MIVIRFLETGFEMYRYRSYRDVVKWQDWLEPNHDYRQVAASEHPTEFFAVAPKRRV